MKQIEKFQMLSRYYDEQWGEWYKHHLPFLMNLLETSCPSKAEILDLGCGTGALVEYLCSLGHQAEGIDLSPEMINIARNRNLSGDRFRIQNMCRFEPIKKYDLVTSTFFALNYQEKDQLDDLFFSVSMSLKQGGIFFFDSYTEHLLKNNHHGTLQHSSGELSFAEERIYEEKLKTAYTRFHFPDQTVEVHKQYPYNLTDLLGSIMTSGLYVLHSYGGFNGEPYVSDSEQLVCVVAKPVPGLKSANV